MAAAYEAIQRAPGEDFDWDRFRTLFIPQATLIPNAEQSPGGAFTVYTPETFISTMDSYTTVSGPNDRGFAEEGVNTEVHRGPAEGPDAVPPQPAGDVGRFISGTSAVGGWLGMAEWGGGPCRRNRPS